jgi:RNA 2',3'-cyclic 3'-phosphodiesterase
VRRGLVAQQAQWTWPAGATLTPADKLHLTLHFIGDVPVARVAELAEGPHVSAPRVALMLDTAGLWPNRCAVLCPSQVPAPFDWLHGALAQALRALELPVEQRPFRPHVTLARHAAGAVPPLQPGALFWPVRGYALVQSAGGRYRPLARYRWNVSSPTRAGSG